MKNVKEALDDKSDDPIKSSLEKSGIAGTENEKEEDKDGKKDSEKAKENGEKKDEEQMDVSIRKNI